MDICREKLVPYLPKAASDLLLNEGRQTVAMGLIRYGGRSEALYSRLRENFRQIHGLDLQELFDKPDDTKLNTAVELMKAGSVCDLETMGRELGLDSLQSMPPKVQETILAVFPTIYKVHNHGYAALLNDVCQRKIPSSFYTDIMINGFYSSERLPPWLTESGRSVLREKSSLDAIRLFEYESEISAIQNDGVKYDLISLSNIYDWAPQPAAIAGVQKIAQTLLNPGGYILIRRACGGCEAIVRGAGAVSVDEDADLNARLSTMDHTPFFCRGKPGEVLIAARFS